MNAEFVRERITQLRLQKGVSEYQMSYDLGHSRGYINNISSGKTLPSMTEFFAICGYFQITPVDFFNTSAFNPVLLNNTLDNISKLNEEDLKLIYQITTRMLKNEISPQRFSLLSFYHLWKTLGGILLHP